jgi:hypothetical protein
MTMDRRTVVKGSLWAVPAVMVAAAAPTVAASVTEGIDTAKSCKLPSQRQAADYRLYLNLVGTYNVLGVKINGFAATTWTPNVVSPSSNVVTVGTIQNADSQATFEVITDKGSFTGVVKALPCKD